MPDTEYTLYNKNILIAHNEKLQEFFFWHGITMYRTYICYIQYNKHILIARNEKLHGTNKTISGGINT